MEVLAILVMGAVNVACFIIGAKVGLAVQKDRSISEEFRIANPIEQHREKQRKRDAQREQDKMDIIMHNIEAYDGTSIGQRDVPQR